MSTPTYIKRAVMQKGSMQSALNEMLYGKMLFQCPPSLSKPKSIV